MTDPMPRKDLELPHRMPEAAIIAELRAENARLRADAQAAVALAYDTIAKEVAAWSLTASEEIERLAPVDGLAEVEAMRKEIADLKLNMDADLRTMVRDGEKLRTLTTDLTAVRAQIEALRGAVRQLVKAINWAVKERERGIGGIRQPVVDYLLAAVDQALAALPAKEGE